MSEDRVVEALRALRDADAHVEAAPQVEVRLMQAVRRRRARRVWLGAGVAAMAAAAAVVMLLHARRVDPLPAKSSPPVVAVVSTPPPVTVPVAAKPRPVRRKPRVPREVATEFYPLVELAQPVERSELRRVTVPASTMRDVGLFVNATHLDDPVQADVLIGEQGLAIRFVSYQY